MRGGRLNWHDSHSFDWSQLNDSQGGWHGWQPDANTDHSAGRPDWVNDLRDGLQSWHEAHNGDTGGWHGWHGSHDHGGTPTPDPVPPVLPPVDSSPDPAPGDGGTPVPPVVSNPDPGTIPDPTSPAPGDGGTPVPPVVSNPDPGTIPDPTTPEPTDPGSQPTPVNLTHSTTPIETTQDGQIIEGLDLYVSSGDAITVSNDDVIIRNCRIHYEDGNGVFVNGASNVTIENTEIINSSPPDGQNPESDTDLFNIYAYQAEGLKVDQVTLRDGSSGIYLLESPNAQLSNLEGYDFHGPFPRGQFVQFDKSEGGTLTNFYMHNDPQHSMPEDNISVYESPNVTISHGLIDGNNSVSGVGVMFEGTSQGGKVDYVDVVHQGNGGFSSYAPDVTFDHTRSFDNIDGDQGRGDSASNALIWNVSNSGVSIDNSTYTNPGNPDNIVWDESKAVMANVSEDANAHPMSPPVHNDFYWSV